ncbi:MAG: hypothetical protein QM749_10680 [Aquabacterium sp.]
MKVKALVSLLALAGAVGAANAAVNTTLNNSELFFTAYDTANQTKSYTFDTGVNVASLIDGSINYSVNLGSDNNWNSFVSAVGGLSNVGWYVEAVQNQPGVNSKFVYATLGAGAAVGTLGTNTAFNSAANPLITAISNTTVSAGNSEIDAAGTAAYLGNSAAAGQTFDQFSPAGVGQLSNVVGTTGVSFFGVANSNTTKPTSKVTLFSTPTPVAGFTSGGLLTIAAVPVVTPSVPEPSSCALALTALAGIGFIARRRAK